MSQPQEVSISLASASGTVQSSAKPADAGSIGAPPKTELAAVDVPTASTAARIEQLPIDPAAAPPAPPAAPAISNATDVTSKAAASAAAPVVAASTSIPTPPQATDNAQAAAATVPVTNPLTVMTTGAAVATSAAVAASVPAQAPTQTPLATVADARTAPAPRSKPSTSSNTKSSASARSAQPGGNRRDTDVDIVTALMSSIEGRPTTSSRSSSKAADSIVPPGEVDNIAQLVTSCRSSNRQETLACRWRICKGYWGKAEACPVRDRKAAERAARELQLQSNSSADS